MILILIFLLLMAAVHKRSLGLEKVNKPGLYAIETGLAMLTAIAIFDVAGNSGLRAPAGLALMALVIIGSCPIAVIILSIRGLTKYNRDKAEGGFLWCIAGLVIVLFVAGIGVPNFMSAYNKARNADADAARQEMAQHRRQVVESSQPAPGTVNYTPSDGSFIVLLPSPVKEESSASTGRLVRTAYGNVLLNGVAYAVIYRERTNSPGEVESFIMAQLPKNRQGMEIKATGLGDGGREVIAKEKNGRLFWTRGFASGNRVYALMAVTSMDGFPSQDVQGFFASFSDGHGQ